MKSLPNAFPKWRRGKIHSLYGQRWKKRFTTVERQSDANRRELAVGSAIDRQKAGEEREAFVGRMLYDLQVAPEECQFLFGLTYDQLASPGSPKGVKQARRMHILNRMLDVVEERTARFLVIRMRLAATCKREKSLDAD